MHQIARLSSNEAKEQTHDVAKPRFDLFTASESCLSRVIGAHHGWQYKSLIRVMSSWKPQMVVAVIPPYHNLQQQEIDRQAQQWFFNSDD